jgi:thioredoxin reductase
MPDNNNFDVIIVGGSYAGLSAAMALGRSLRSVLIIDSGAPCNSQTPHSHNFLTQDGSTPGDIAAKARSQVLQYKTVRFLNGLATSGKKNKDLFTIRLDSGESFTSKKLLFATGVSEVFPQIGGFSDCWGISLLHCPYCHGYEVRNEQIGLLGNGDLGFELARLINNWSKDLVLYTNGKATLTAAQTNKLEQHTIKITEKEISHLEHSNGYIEQVVFKDNSRDGLKALFTRPGFKQHCEIPEQLGCEMTEQGYIKVDDFQKTSIYGMYAAGDNTTPFRAVSAAVAAGSKAGAMINKELIEESF